MPAGVAHVLDRTTLDGTGLRSAPCPGGDTGHQEPQGSPSCSRPARQVDLAWTAVARKGRLLVCAAFRLPTRLRGSLGVTAIRLARGKACV